LQRACILPNLQKRFLHHILGKLTVCQDLQTVSKHTAAEFLIELSQCALITALELLYQDLLNCWVQEILTVREWGETT
jgi:hypothetical protein